MLGSYQSLFFVQRIDPTRFRFIGIMKSIVLFEWDKFKK